jgi:uncharacterized protein (TIGR01777 family)
VEFVGHPIPTPEEIVGLDGFVNLAGENIAGVRWTDSAKEKFYESRISHTKSIVRSIRESSQTLSFFLSASAIGYYGSYEEAGPMFTESSPPGNGFLSQLSQDWESAALDSDLDPKTRILIPRIGIVLDPKGGALAKMRPIFLAGLGGPLGSGNQGMSWIHRDDLVRAFLDRMDRAKSSEIFNVVSPNPVSNREFSEALGKALHRPALIPTPGFAIKLLFGEGAKVVTEGQFVRPEKLLKEGFEFRFPDLSSALQDLL